MVPIPPIKGTRFHSIDWVPKSLKKTIAPGVHSTFPIASGTLSRRSYCPNACDAYATLPKIKTSTKNAHGKSGKATNFNHVFGCHIFFTEKNNLFATLTESSLKSLVTFKTIPTLAAESSPKYFG